MESGDPSSALHAGGQSGDPRTNGAAASSALSSARSSPSSRVLVSTPDKADIAALLECPVCYDLMIPPIVSCSKGHNVCSDCRARIRHCPVCREMYTPGNLRNLFAEQLANKCQILCKYTSSGCNAIISGSSIRDHQKCCNFRPLTCPDCDTTVSYEQFLQHIQDHDVHQVRRAEYSTGYEIQDADFTSAPQKWELTWLFCHNANFLCHTEKHETCWSFWISCAENNAHLDDYMCEIVLWNKDKRCEVKYKGPINSMRTKAKEVLANASGLILTKESIRAFVFRGGVDVVFRIMEGQYEIPRIATMIPPLEEPQSETEREPGVAPVGVGTGLTDPPPPYSAAAPEPQPQPPAYLTYFGPLLEHEAEQPGSDNDYSDFESVHSDMEVEVGDSPRALSTDSQTQATRPQLLRLLDSGGTSRSGLVVPASSYASAAGAPRRVPSTSTQAEMETDPPQVETSAQGSPSTNQQPTSATASSPRSALAASTPRSPRSDGDGAPASASTAGQAQDRRPGRTVAPPSPPPRNRYTNANLTSPRLGGVGHGQGATPGRGRGFGRGRNLRNYPNNGGDSVENGF